MRNVLITTLTVVLTTTLGSGAVLAAPEATHATASAVTADAEQSTVPEPEFVGELGRGDALFWDGPHLDSVGTGTRVADPVLCDSPVATYLSCIPTELYPALAQASAVSAWNGIALPVSGVPSGAVSPGCDHEGVMVVVARTYAARYGPGRLVVDGTDTTLCRTTTFAFNP